MKINESKDIVGKTSKVVFVEEDQEKGIKEISRVLRMVGESGDGASAGTKADASEETGREQNNQVFKAGTLTAEGDDYRITLDYGEEARIPENASLSVREITAETDKEAYEACLEQAGQQVASDDKTSVDQKASRFFDIEILVTETESDGTEKSVKIEPSAPVSVNIQIDEKPASQESETDQSEPTILHFAEEGVEQIDSTVTDSQNDKVEEQKTEIQFEADTFSVYGVVYTVDFHWEVNGKTYEFSIPGGGFVSLQHLVEALGIGVSDTEDIPDDKNNSPDDINDTSEDINNASDDIDDASGDINEPESTENDAESTENEPESIENDADKAVDDAASEESRAQREGRETYGIYDEAIKLNEAEVSEDARKFVADVESVEFSSPELVWVGKVNEAAAVGGLKETNGLKVEYSADLTEEQIAEINAQMVEAGDWALISLKPFDTEETLTVTMKNGDRFVVNMTDAQAISPLTLDNLNGKTVALIGYDNAMLTNQRITGTQKNEGETGLAKQP